MKSFFHNPASLFAVLLLLSACSPEEPSASVEPEVWTTESVKTELSDFTEDLSRILAVAEPLKGDLSAQAQRLLQDEEFQKIVSTHLEEIESFVAALASMTPEERANFAETIEPALVSIELRMTEICACGPAAEDAFAPFFVAAQEALRGAL